MKPRLIDANALKEILNTFEASERGRWESGFSECWESTIDAIESAPTVETTDELIKDWNSEYKLHRFAGVWIAECFRKYLNGYRSYKAEGETPVEAIKRLESSLNPK